MDHSLKSYLHRRSNEELEIGIQFCLRQKDYNFYEHILIMIIDILEERYKLSPSDLWKQKISDYYEMIKLRKAEIKTD